MAGKHGIPSAGKTPDGNKGQKPQKGNIAQRNESGTILPKATSKLWGWRSGKKP